MNSTRATSATLSSSPETPPAIFSVADSEGPIIGTPTLDNPNPDSNDDVDVTVPIDDIDGVENATLFWEYTYNNTQFNSTIIGTTTDNIFDESGIDFDDALLNGDTGDITGTGLKDPASSTDWRYGEYTYNASAVSYINLDIRGPGGPTRLVYVLIKAKNFTTGNWETVYENGGYGLSDDLFDEPYSNTTLTLGYYILAVTYRSGGGANDPEFDTLFMDREVYEWTIPAANNATFVDYSITAFDLNQSSSSPTYTFLMDFTPTLFFEIPPPSSVGGDEEISFTIRVQDPDGYDTINISSGILYYWFSDPSITTEIALIHDYDDPFGGTYGYQYFNGTIPAGNIQNNETDLYFRVNVSDIVEGTRGREERSSRQTVWVDSLNPRVTGITIDGGVFIGKNVTLINRPAYITANLYDPSSISSVAIYYSMPNGTAPIKLIMQNTTNLGGVTETFDVTLPATNETAFVEYFFETEDFLGNKGNTSLINFYYSDALGPVLDTLSTYPTIISNYTEVLVLFNSTDFSGLMQSVLWYSFDNQISWDFTGANNIDYQDGLKSETFKATDLHYIKDNATSSFPLEVIRSIPVDEAILTFEITHEMPTDLRIWLKLDDGRKYILYDREPGQNTFTRNIDLFSLGMTENDFTSGNFTLEIQDFFESYSGSITKYEIEIIDYKYPLGYQFFVKIPASENDTTVFFYITMTDNLWNSANTSIYQYYADGIAPSISVTQLSSPMDLAGKHYIRIFANIADQGGVLSADTYYKFAENDDWAIGTMSLNSTSGNYFFDVPISTENGTLFYKVRAFDLVGLSSETTIYSVSYSHGLAPFIEIQGIPYPSPLDMEGTNTIRIWANVTDFDGQVANCTIGYRFTDTDEWKFEDMVFDEESGYYYFDVKVNRKSGNLTFIISASDNLNLTSETDPYTIEFENAGTTPGLPTDLLLFGAVLAIGGGGSIAAVAYLSKKGKLKLPERFSRGD